MFSYFLLVFFISFFKYLIAVPSPTPAQPGTLSDLQPPIALTSAHCCGSIPNAVLKQSSVNSTFFFKSNIFVSSFNN